MRPDEVVWGGHPSDTIEVKFAEFTDVITNYYVSYFVCDAEFVVSEECEDKQGELVHRTYWITDALQWACFLTDKEQVHGQAGTGEQAADQRVPRERDAARARQE